MEILDFVETPMGHLILRRRELLGAPGTIVTEVTLGGELLMSSHYSISERALSSRALAWHGNARSVLVGGLGLGATAHEALGVDGVEDLIVVETHRPVIDWLERGLLPLSDELRGDPRFSVRETNVFALLLGEPKETFDVVLLDVDHSPEELLDPAHAPFYEPAGLERARDHLRPDGVLAVWSSDASPRFLENLRGVFREAKSETIAWRNELIEHEARDELFLARR